MSLPPRSSSSFDPSTIDLPAFLAELEELRAEIDASVSEEDARHLKRVERWGRFGTLVGLSTAWIFPNPISAIGLGLGRSTRWLVMHHVGHRGYDRVPGIAPHRTSRGFAKGWRRYIDWLDWMHPEAWIYEHNVLHHSHTGEEADPDLLERNAEDLQRHPRWARYAILFLLAITWRASYYAPSTLDAWREKREAQRKKRGEKPLPPRWLELWGLCYLPYGLFHFALLPALFLFISPWAALSVLLNSLMAEVITNVHTFLVVGPNHTGDDLYRFARPPKNKAERMLFQTVGSVNFATGGDRTDYAHLWLNYQIEHHIFPDLSMLQYQRVQPAVKALCAKYGVPYVQESVWTRARKMVDVVVGASKMRRFEDVEAPQQSAAA